MLLTFAAGGLVGLLLGFWFRVPAVVAASGVTAVICLSVAPFTELGPASAVAMTFALMGVLQLGYLAGVVVSGMGPSRSSDESGVRSGAPARQGASPSP